MNKHYVTVGWKNSLFAGRNRDGRKQRKIKKQLKSVAAYLRESSRSRDPDPALTTSFITTGIIKILIILNSPA